MRSCPSCESASINAAADERMDYADVHLNPALGKFSHVKTAASLPRSRGGGEAKVAERGKADFPTGRDALSTTNESALEEARGVNAPPRVPNLRPYRRR